MSEIRKINLFTPNPKGSKLIFNSPGTCPEPKGWMDGAKLKINSLFLLLFNTFNICFLFLLAASCANMVPLGGGAKDEKPPVVQFSDPPDNSVNFAGDRITFNFDEFIQLKNAQQKFLVSPPMKETPELRARNKELTVVFKSPPEPNTTYTLNFADGIADLNEGNAINNFIYTFSTGNKADSLKVSGQVKNSFTLEPEKNVSVFLYNITMDSLPYIATPYYVTRTDNSGYFRFINIKEGRYSIISVSDKNNNYRVDPPDESIAFLSEKIEPFVTFVTDSAESDTVPALTRSVFGPDTLLLLSFADEIPKQKVKKVTRVSPYKAEILFAHESPVRPSLNCISQSKKEWINQYSVKNDSLVLWAPDTVSFLAEDTVLFEIKYGFDSLGITISKTDTVKVPPFVAKGKGEARKATPLPVRFSAGAGGKTHPASHMFLEASSPIKDFTAEKLSLSEMTPDSQYIPLKISLSTDSLNPCRIYVNTSVAPVGKYRLIIEKGFVRPLHADPSDSTGWSFSVNPAESYGNLKITIQDPPAGSCFALTDDKGRLLQTWSGDTVKVFSFLNPGKYKVMLFIDENRNGRWDTGRYLAGIQPEKVLRYERDISIRANWDMDVIWTIKKENNGQPD